MSLTTLSPDRVRELAAKYSRAPEPKPIKPRRLTLRSWVIAEAARTGKSVSGIYRAIRRGALNPPPLHTFNGRSYIVSPINE